MMIGYKRWQHSKNKVEKNNKKSQSVADPFESNTKFIVHERTDLHSIDACMFFYSGTSIKFCRAAPTGHVVNNIKSTLAPGNLIK